MKHLKMTGGIVGAGALVLSLMTSSPAVADSLNIDDARALLSTVAPGVEGQSTATTDIEQTRTSARSARGTATAPELRVETAPEGEAKQSVRFTLDGAVSQTETGNGLLAFSTSSSDVARYVTENPLGARVITAYQTAQDDYDSTTTFHFDGGFTPIARPDGSYLIDVDGVTIGAIEAPWARDARGRDLPTDYSWVGSVLHQHVEVPADVAFPVVADPGWTYTWTAVASAGSVSDINSRMHTCFNCIFPVEGAPKAWPKAEQKLPLVVRPFPGGPASNFNCVFMDWAYDPSQYFFFEFRGDTGHVDGPGSGISFQWYYNPVMETGEKIRFTVFATVMNDNPGGIPQAVYLVGAKNNWAMFVENYMRATGGGPHAWHWIN